MDWLIAALALFILLGCEKGSPVAEEGTQLTLRASPTAIFSHGDTAMITVTATESDGRPALDGLRIQLSATGGSLPAEIRTVDGVATASFISDSQPGMVTVTARSGSIGADGTVNTTLEVLDRNVPIGAAILTVNPSNLSRNGGAIQARVVLTDEGGNPLPDRVVVLSSDLGQFARNGAPLVTDASGQAVDTLVIDRVPSGLDSVTVEAQAGDQQLSKTISITDNANPVPMIEFSPQQPRRDEVVFFNATRSSDSDGDIEAYRWQFGDGTVATGPQVSHTYTKAGTFGVILEVEDDLGARASTTANITVGDNEPPEPAFRFSPTSPRVFEAITFNASDSLDTDGTIEAYLWDMGNGTFREGPIITHAYQSAGTFNVSLTVRDNDGATASTSQDIAVEGNAAPIADFFFSPTAPRVGEAVTFDAADATDTDGTINSYQWQFGDGESAAGEITQHTYTQAGSYVVRLTVKDNDGSSDTRTLDITVVDNLSPIAAFNASPSAPRVGQAVTFSASDSSDPDGQITRYAWAFGDGGFGNGQLVTHSYLAEGDYQITLTVTDNDGKQSSRSQSLTVNRGGVPQARLVIQPDSLEPPGGQVVLDASQSTDQESDISDLEFKFSAVAPTGTLVDIASGLSPIRFAGIANLGANQQVIFSVMVTDPDGNTGTASAVLTASQMGANQPPQADFTITPTGLAAPGGSLILDASNTTDGDHDIGELHFDYAYQTSGNVHVQITAANGPLNTAMVTDGDPGDAITFLLTVTDPAGGQDAISKTLTLMEGQVNTPPSVSLTSVPETSVTAPDNPAMPITITLDGRGSSDAETALEQLTFEFSGDSSNRDARVEIERFPQDPGLATALVYGAEAGDQLLFTLRVTDAQGASTLTSLILQVVP